MSDAQKKIITMGDYIRNASDEKLADIFQAWADCGKCRFLLECSDANKDRPISEMISWCHDRFIRWFHDEYHEMMDYF